MLVFFSFILVVFVELNETFPCGYFLYRLLVGFGWMFGWILCVCVWGGGGGLGGRELSMLPISSPVLFGICHHICVVNVCCIFVGVICSWVGFFFLGYGLICMFAPVFCHVRIVCVPGILFSLEFRLLWCWWYSSLSGVSFLWWWFLYEVVLLCLCLSGVEFLVLLRLLLWSACGFSGLVLKWLYLQFSQNSQVPCL